jgi:transcriptional regulator with XRE-family HTH domain
MLLRLYRMQNGLTVRQAAQEIGVSHATVSRLERGYTFDLATWRAIDAWLQKPTTKTARVKR